MGSGAWTPTSDSDASPRAIRLAAIELGLRERGEEHTLDVEAATIAELNDQDISHGWTRAHEIATCTPPVRTLQPFDREARWESLQGERFDAFLAASGPVIWNDSAGAGKTTSAALASADRGLNHALTFPTHEKAREHILGDATPDGYFHLKGPEQPLHDCCLDAKIAADDDEDAFCQEHGSLSEN